MSQAGRTLVFAVPLAAFAFGRPFSPVSLAAVLAAVVLAGAGLAIGRPRSWGLRLGYGLLLAYLAGWIYFGVDSWRLTRYGGEAVVRLEEAKRARIAATLEDRLREDRALAKRVADGLDARGRRIGTGVVQDPELFVALRQVVPPSLPRGVGIEVYDGAGSLRAWWGDPRGESLPPDSVPGLDGALVRRPAGYTLAYASAPWVVSGDTFRVVVKDVWAVESPLRRGVTEAGLLLAELEAREDLAFRLRPTGATSPAGQSGSLVRGPGGRGIAVLVSERFMIDRYVEERQLERSRLLALLFLWPLLWSLATVWQAVRHAARDSPRPLGRHGWVLAILGQLAILALLWVFLLESRLLALLLPARWFSPLPFASELFGPGGRSPGDFLVTAAFAAFFGLAAYALLPGRRDRPPGWRLTLAAVTAFGIALLAVQAAEPVLEAALASMSPPVFFSPTLLFAPPFLMVLLAFALLAALLILVLAAGFRLMGAPAGSRWTVGLLAAAGVAVGLVAWRLPQASMAGDRLEVAPLLALAILAAAWLGHTVARPLGHRAGPAVVRLGLVAAGMGALVILPLATFARVQAAHEVLVERAERIGQASTQWLQYTMSRTIDFLAGDPAVAEAIEAQNRDAALLLWSQSPLRSLDFATGLYLLDAQGTVVSQFALTAEDLSDGARRRARVNDAVQVDVEGGEGEQGTWWATVPVFGDSGRIGTAVAMTTEALDLREPTAEAGFVLTDLLAGGDRARDLPGYTTYGPTEVPPPRMILTRIQREGGQGLRLAMPLDPLLPGARGTAIFLLAGALCGILLGLVERWGDLRARTGWWSRLPTLTPLRSFRAQLLLAFLAVAAVPLTLYAVLGYRATRLELEEATRTAAAEALNAASRVLVDDPALAQGTTRVLTERLRGIADFLQQDLILYWRGRTIASSRPEIFASRLFADRMEGEVYTALFAERHELVFESTTLGDRSFLVAYRPLVEPGAPGGYVLATPLLIREDRARVDLQRLGEGVLLLSAFSIGFLLVVGWWLARHMARPLSALERGTRQIAAGRLSYRLPEPARRDEFGRLQRSFNAMAARLDASQRALEREKSRVQAILSSVGAGVVALDESGLVRLLNDRAARLLDQRPEDVLDRSVADLARRAAGAQRFWGAVNEELQEGRRSDRDLVLRRDGSERHYHLVCTGLKDGAGEERGLVVAFEDITANVQSQRVLAWGEMARQVAHEIKNPLTPMKLSLQHLERTVDDRPENFEILFHANLDLILAEIDRLERIAGNFARFAVPDPAVRVPFPALEVAREVLALFAPGEEAVEYRVETLGEPRPLLGDPEGFRRILLNLFQNAREAVLAAGTGTVELRLDWEREPGWAWISVLDDGIGLPEEGLERLFEPSFSTKTRGTGLGLAITRRIVEAWGGTIDYERLQPGGTAIHVRLEITDRED